jgi:hypothetical protein
MLSANGKKIYDELIAAQGNLRELGGYCPSSNDLRPLGALVNGVSGPSGFEVDLRFRDTSSGGAGWFCA